MSLRDQAWWRMAMHAIPVYVMSRLCVLAGAAVVAAEQRVDTNLALELNLPVSDPHCRERGARRRSSTHPMTAANNTPVTAVRMLTAASWCQCRCRFRWCQYLSLSRLWSPSVWWTSTWRWWAHPALVDPFR